MHIRPVISATVLATGTLLALPMSGSAQTPLEDPIPEPIAIGAVRIGLEPVATGLTAPNWGTSAPGCPTLRGRLFVTDQDGILWNINLATGQKTPYLDVSDRLVSLGVAGPGTFDERGLLGVAFHPEFARNGLLYTYTSEPVEGAADFSTMPAGTTANHQSVVREWQVRDPCGAVSVVDPATVRELLRIDEPQFNHNAGALEFGPDGRLYIALGDGGAADDQGAGHVEGGNGQTPGNILGSILRIDPLGANAANGQYGIPPDNPFAGMPAVVEEIFAYGFRNPFRFSFDSATGEMYIGDVGQNDIEEISIGVAGGNFGWRIKEGSFCFDPNGADPGFVFACGAGDTPGTLIDPVAEYDHDEGIAIVGGFVYRGRDIPELWGRYVFGDFRHPTSGSGRLFYLQRNNRILEFQLADRDTLGLSVLGFGQDADGELYLLASQTGVPFGETGVVLRLTSTRGQGNNFRVHLDGGGEVPAVDTNAQGQGSFRVDETGSRIDFTLVVANIQDVFASHIHCAPAGVNGPIGVTLFAGDAANPDGVLAEGTIEEPDAGNACGWTTVEQVVQAIRFGLAYVNVHTLAHPSGEIRGQIR
jgi:glucose/arabinose dehydrogenase